MLQLASARDAALMDESDMRMYLLKQSLVHLPMLWIMYFGQPMAAAVDAAPILRE